MRYICCNCQTEFEYFHYSTRSHYNHFCGQSCKNEWHYLSAYMSNTQLKILAHLLDMGGIGRVRDSASIDSLRYKIAPLIIVHQERDSTNTVIAEITDNGKRWFSAKRSM